FNPRLRAKANRRHSPVRSGSSVSIHAFVRRRTGERPLLHAQPSVSIHAFVRRRTFCGLDRVFGLSFQSTPSCEGEPLQSTHPHHTLRFNPRLRAKANEML